MRILFIGPNRIGDAVLASGLLNHLLGDYPHARITVACGAAAAPLFEALPQLETLIPMTKTARSAHWWRLWKQVARYRWDMVVDTRRSVVPWVILAGRRHAAPASSAGPLEHAVVTFARALGMADDPPSPRIWMSPEHSRRAQELIPDGKPVLAVGPTANWPGKVWRAERFCETAEELTSASADVSAGGMPGARIAVFGAATERDIAAPLLQMLPPERTIDLVGEVDLLTASACLARSDMYIGNDSGLMHMSAAVGTPTLGLFGPSMPERYAPWGDHTAWVRTDKDVHEIVSEPGYDHRNTGTLMDGLPVDRVVTAAQELRTRTMERAA